MSLFAIALAQGTRQKITVFQRLGAREETRVLAESAVKGAMAELKSWGQGQPTSLWSLAKAEKGFSAPSGGAQVKVDAENARINLNKASAQVLKQLFQSAAQLHEETADELAWAVIDFRDADDAVSTHFDGGSEKESYARAGMAHAPKNGDFEFAGEMLLVKGITKEIYSLVRNYITIYGDGRVNINVCSKETMLSLDMMPELAEKIIAARSGLDRTAGTEDDFVFGDVTKIERQMADSYPLSEIEKISLRHAIGQGYLGVSSDVFRIEANASLNRPPASGAAVCVYALNEGVKYWMET